MLTKVKDLLAIHKQLKFEKKIKPMKLEIGKEYVTRSGLKVKIYDIAKDGNHPVIGGVYEGNNIHVIPYTKEGDVYMDVASRFDIAGEWQEPLDFDWSCLPPWTNEYIAMEENGTWFAYSMMPKMLYPRFWRKEGGYTIIIPEEYAPKNFNGTWDKSLFKNPNIK